MTLLTIEIGIIRELAITASLGVAVIILTNLILLPVLMSYIKFSERFKANASKPNHFVDSVWQLISGFAKPVPAMIVILCLPTQGPLRKVLENTTNRRNTFHINRNPGHPLR